MIGEPVCVAPTGDVCGEGAVWHAAHNAVYWTDINRFLIHRLNLADSSVRTWLFVRAQTVDATPSGIKAVFKGGVYEAREKVWAFGGAEERGVASLEGRADIA